MDGQNFEAMLERMPLLKAYAGDAPIRNICGYFGCGSEELSGFEPITEGLNNYNFRFSFAGQEYVYRHPGELTVGVMDRKAETQIEKIASDLGFDKTFLYEDAESGWKLSKFIRVTKAFDYHDRAHVRGAMRLIRELHESGAQLPTRFDLAHETAKVKAKIRPETIAARPDFHELDSRNSLLLECVRTEGELTVCHNDFFDPNILVSGEEFFLIDWEYAGMSDYASDLGTFICCSDYSFGEATDVLREYFGREPSDAELRHCLAYISIAGFYWYVFALYYDGTDYGWDAYEGMWHEFAREYGEIAEKLYSSK